MKKILFLLFVILFIGCDMPYKIIETYKTDTNGITTKTVEKIYSSGETSIQSTIVLGYDPFLFPRPYYFGRPYYGPRPIMVTPTPRIYSPRGKH